MFSRGNFTARFRAFSVFRGFFPAWLRPLGRAISSAFIRSQISLLTLRMSLSLAVTLSLHSRPRHHPHAGVNGYKNATKLPNSAPLNRNILHVQMFNAVPASAPPPLFQNLVVAACWCVRRSLDDLTRWEVLVRGIARIPVADRATAGVIHSSEPRKANPSAVTQVNPVRPRYEVGAANLPTMAKPASVTKQRVCAATGLLGV